MTLCFVNRCFPGPIDITFTFGAVYYNEQSQLSRNEFLHKFISTTVIFTKNLRAAKLFIY